MGNSVDDRLCGAPMASRTDGASSPEVTHEQCRQCGWIDAENY
jgi:hypothetical protein